MYFRRTNLSAIPGLFVLLSALISFGATNEVASINSPGPSVAELKKFSLSELVEMEITSVSKKPEKLSQAAAAIYVITSEDIRRSGAMNIPEALRMAPGFDVARIDSHRYAVSSRGFNDEFANKLLVLIDGRAVYTPLFGGVFWDQQDTVMEDIDRIEVIRGPGGTLWGANAVNGVVNVITKNAKETQGVLISGGGGTEELGFGSVRYGGKVAENIFFRVYEKSFARGALANGDVGNGMQHNQGGFRLDWEASPQNLLTLQGDYYQGNASETLLTPTTTPPTFAQVIKNQIDYKGGNLLGRWDHNWADDSQTELLFYYDHTERFTLATEKRNTGNIDFQHCFKPTEQQEIVAGLGYRISADTTEPGVVAFNPQNRSLQLFSAFVQDEIELADRKLHLIFGSKFEHNDFTGFEFQPNARLAWLLHPRHTLWAAVSRAVRMPTRTDHDVEGSFPPVAVPGSPVPFAVHGLGNKNFQSETLLAYEVGYRVQPHDRFTLDVAAFYNNYDRLRSGELVATNLATVPPLFTELLSNKLKGETYGVELASQWQVTDRWTLRPSYTFLEIQLQRTASGTDVFGEKLEEGRSPKHQFALRSALDLSRHWEADVWLRYVDDLSSLHVPSYVTADARLAWHPTKNLELAIVGQNLFEPRHAEFFQTNFGVPGRPAEVQRGVYGKLTWRF